MVDEFKLEILTTWPIHEELKKLEVLGKWGSLCCSAKEDQHSISSGAHYQG
jgi:hypothetical protein